MKRSIIFGSVLLLLFSCNQEHRSNENLVAASVDSTAKVQKISDEALGDIIKSIPSPLEISVLIKESGAGYDNKLLNSSENSTNYNTNYKRALNLGIYGADLGYINIFNKSKDALSYLSSIRGLAEDLNIGQFYDFETIKRLASNSENIDSLLYITTSTFEDINDFLHQKKRSDQSVLILTGGWIEALHISCEIAKKNKNEELFEKIGEQKIVLDQLLLLVTNFKGESNMNSLALDLENLKKVYDKIQITYTYQESTMEEVNGVLMIVDKSESKVNVKEEHIQEISALIDSLRNKIINA